MTWYYTREVGEEGQVLTDEGLPPGVRLTDLLEQGPLPMGVVLECIAYLADILTIAEEDKAMHGDISPGDVFIDEKGSVSISNYGPMRSQGRAPEGRPLFPASDVYGLGVVLHAALSSSLSLERSNARCKRKSALGARSEDAKRLIECLFDK